MADKPYRLMIDPGHGGPDPGATNKSLGIKEKDVNLAIALKMMRKIYAGDYLLEPFITRKDDSFVTLDGRCKKAALFSVDAFISIHCNARKTRGRDGLEIEVFHYCDSERANQYANIALGFLLNGLNDRIKIISRGVKTAQFYILKHTPMPAILVELGFISDDEEAAFLSAVDNQKIIARQLVEATELFLEGGGI